MTTTAEYRKMAREAAAVADWEQAAALYTLAIDNYPARSAQTSIGNIDLAKMAAMRDAALAVDKGE